MLNIALNPNGTLFLARGGAPEGGDKINEVVASWPGWARVNTAGRSAVSTFVGPMVTTSALALSSTSLELRWEHEARQRVDDLLTRFRAARLALESDKHPRLSGFMAQTKRKPKPYQAQGIAAMQLLDGRCWLSDEMGLGKTAQALWFAHHVGARRVLVCCPASVKWNWSREVDTTLGPPWPVQVIDGSASRRANQFTELNALWQRFERLVIVINYDLLNYVTDAHLERLMRFCEGECLLLDEAHYLKNPDAERTRIVRRAFCPSDGGAKWRIAITGTPIRNTVEDVYSQVELVRPGTFQSKHWFLNRFTVRSLIKVGKRKQVTKPIVRGVRNEKELNLILNTLQIRRKKEDVLNLPPKVYTYPELELDKHTAKIYAAMRDYALLLLEEADEELPVLSPVARSAVEAAARCEQIAQGCVGGVPEELLPKLSSALARHAEAVESKDGWLVFPKSAKIAWLTEALDQVNAQKGSSVVFARFNAPLMWLATKRSGLCVTGETPLAQRQEIFDAFQAGEVSELYVQVRIAEGFNLHRAQDEFFLGRDWSHAINAQAVDRCHRIGQKGTVNVQMPFVRGTIEQRQHASLAEKERAAANVLCFQTIKDLKDALR